MPFVRFVLRRAGALVLLCLGITLVVFALTQLVPSNAVATNLGEQAAADPAAVAAFKEHYGLDKPLPVQYWLYLKNLLQGDLGESLRITSRVATTWPGMCRRPPSSRCSRAHRCAFGIAFGVARRCDARGSPTSVARRLARRALHAQFWIALVALYFFFFRWAGPGRRPADPGASSRRTRPACTRRRPAPGQWWTS